MAVDRLCPSTRDRNDRIAARVRELSRARGFAKTDVWGPRLQLRKDRDDQELQM